MAMEGCAMLHRPIFVIFVP